MRRFVVPVAQPIKRLWRRAEDLNELKQLILDGCVEVDGPMEGSPCLLWTGNTDTGGYGVISFHSKPYNTHKAMYLCCVGPVPDGLQVQHKCHWRDCCRPEHLKLGTPKQNSEDMVAAGRSTAGEANPKASLKREQVVEILRMIGEGKSNAQIERHFGVSRWLVSKIATGVTWKDVPGPRRQPRKPTNRFHGVQPDGRRWQAYLHINGKQKYLGNFGFEVDAAVCVNYHIAYLGLNKPLNVIPEGEWCHD